jgi:autotransporter-associated beta strand protein
MASLLTNRLIRSRVLVGGIALSVGLSARAQSTWTGLGGDANWSSGANWSGGTPGSGLTTAVTFAGGTNLNPNQNIANPFVLNSLTFAAGTAPFNLGGNGLRFDGTTPAISQASAVDQTITSPVTFGSSGQIGGAGTGGLILNALTVASGSAASATVTVMRPTVTLGGLTLGNGSSAAQAVFDTGTNTVRLGGNIAYNPVDGGTEPAVVHGTFDLNGGTRTIGGTGFSNTQDVYDVLFDAALTGLGGLTYAPVANAAGNAPFTILTRANSYTGATAIGGSGGTAATVGRLYLGAAGAIPATSAVSITGKGYLSVYVSQDNTVGVSAGGFDQTFASLSSTPGTILRLGFSTVTFGGNNADTAIDGTIVQFEGSTGTLTKVGSGTVTMSAANTYNSVTRVNGGALLVTNTAGSATGTGPVVVAGGATLGGTGAIVPGAGNTVTINGTASPGLTTGAIGTLAFGSAASTTGVILAGQYVADLGVGTTSDLLAVNGSLNISGSTLNLSGTASGGTYTLATFSPNQLTGTFSSVANMPSGYAVIADASSIRLVPVPEPVAVLAICGAAAALSMGIRRGWIRRC